MKRTWKGINWLWFAGAFTAAYALAVGYTMGWWRTWTFLTTEHDLNEVGDFLAGIFAPIALIWLVAAVLTQRQELNETREQFRENQAVIDAQLATIHKQNALLALQHEQSLENAKKTYKLSLFDKRFEIYQKFVNFDNEHNHKDYDGASYWAMINLSHEASFVFDQSLADWFEDIANQINDYETFKQQNPWETGSDGHGNTVMLSNQRNEELGRAYLLHSERIRELFRPEERIERFWSYLHVSDQPLIAG
ncbi:hypothetical protein I6F07_21115 [Ensifer sp. IC4062]|nr:hypothetical protein [Ensifer sp. IC4062]MCA1442675.1 hypothetical protein [Ensifer sp. IC4062]